MSTRAGTVPLSDLQFIKIYFNQKRLRSTTANLKKMLAEAGGDAICSSIRTIYPVVWLRFVMRYWKLLVQLPKRFHSLVN